MAITSGVRAVSSSITIGGRSFPFEDASVELSAARKSSRFSARAALNTFPGGDRFFVGLTDNSGSIEVAGQSLVTGEWDSAQIGYSQTAVYLSGRDGSVALQNRTSSEAFKNQTRAEIVQTIAKKAGLTAKVSGGKLLAGKKVLDDYVKLSDGVSYAAILHKLAELENARWFVNGSTLNFISGGTSTYQVAYQPGNPARGNFISLTLDLNFQAAKPITVNVKGWDSKKKKTVSATKKIPAASAGGASTPTPPARPPELGGAGTPTPPPRPSDAELTYNYRADQTQQDHADDLAKHKAEEAAQQELRLRVTMVGDAAVDPTMQLSLQGTAFDQTYDIEDIHHRISAHSGWTMDISAKSARQGRSAQ